MMRKISTVLGFVLPLTCLIGITFLFIFGEKEKIQHSQTTNINCYTRDEQEIDVEVWYIYDSDEELDVVLTQSVVSSTRAILSEYTFKDITVDNVATVERLLTEKVQLENEQVEIEKVTIREVEKVEDYFK